MFRRSKGDSIVHNQPEMRLSATVVLAKVSREVRFSMRSLMFQLHSTLQGHKAVVRGVLAQVAEDAVQWSLANQYEMGQDMSQRSLTSFPAGASTMRFTL